MEKWRGKIAVVTGASAGIGASITKELAQNGINVIALARRVEKIDELVKSIGETSGKIYPHKCDISDFNSIKEAYKWIEDKFTVINILINNAGIVFNIKSTDEGDDVAEKINKTINTNFTGLVHCSREAIRLMKKSNDYSIIVNINSGLGHNIPFGASRMNVYPPTKFALTAYTEILRQELIISENEKIRVSSVSPGATKSDAVISGDFVKKHEDFFDHIKHLQPEDISNAVIFLLQNPVHVNVTELTLNAVGQH